MRVRKKKKLEEEEKKTLEEEEKKTLSKGVCGYGWKAKGWRCHYSSTRIIQQSHNEQWQRWSIIPIRSELGQMCLLALVADDSLFFLFYLLLLLLLLLHVNKGTSSSSSSSWSSSIMVKGRKNNDFQLIASFASTPIY